MWSAIFRDITAGRIFAIRTAGMRKKMHKGTQKVEQKISEDIGIGRFQKIKVRQISGNLMEFP
jgi:hypothetical protein